MEIRKEFLPFTLPTIEDEEIDEVVDTLKNGWLTMGPKTKKFEDEFANYIGCKYAISVNSCTAALFLAGKVLGIKPKDEIILPSLTFASTANIVEHLGARPVFADVDSTICIDPEDIKRKITEKTKAIIPVHYAGHPAAMNEINEIAEDNSILVFEDAAHAVGSEYKGNKIGNGKNLACFSFYATKNMTTGEGGMITTNNEKFAEKLRILRLHGISRDAWKRYSSKGSWYYEVTAAGYKCNMTDINASLGLAQLRKVDSFNKKRAEIVEKYNSEFSKTDVLSTIKSRENTKPAYHLYPLIVDFTKLSLSHAEFIDKFKEYNIGVSLHFIPLHLQPYYKEKYNYKEGDLPKTERFYNSVVSLPLHPRLSDRDVKYIVDSVIEIIQKNKN